MKPVKTDITLEVLLDLCPKRLKALFLIYLDKIPSLDLKVAMEYALFNHGKLLRPLLIYATGSCFGATLADLDVPASSVELIHTYSLIHDDLPCMDNADLRRGKATLHKVYSEGMAVLTGDALHTLAMQIMVNHPSAIKTERRLQMIRTLSQACGPYGMAAGQSLDLNVMNDDTMSQGLLFDIYRLKTGALFTACIELGRLASKDDDEINQQALRKFGTCIGLAFQIQDDIFDIESAAEISGKPQGSDAKNKKITYPKLAGMAKAKAKVQTLYEEAIATINYLGQQAQLLRDLTGNFMQRHK